MLILLDIPNYNQHNFEFIFEELFVNKIDVFGKLYADKSLSTTIDIYIYYIYL